MADELVVTGVRERYPARPKRIVPHNITAEVTCESHGRFMIRFDDAASPDWWMEVFVRLVKEVCHEG